MGLDKYIENGGSYCVNCNSTQLRGENVELWGGTVTQIVKCEKCNHEWRDVYTLTGIELFNNED